MQCAYASSVTQFLHLNDEALDFILSSTNREETSLDCIEASLRKYFESRGVVFDERGSLNFDGTYIILVETKENREKIEGICEELWEKFGGKVKPPFILKDFSHARIRNTYIDSYYEPLSEITLFWHKKKGCGGVQIIVLGSDEFEDDSIIYRQNIEMYSTPLEIGPIDPFNTQSNEEKMGPIFCAVTFECRPDSLNRIYVGCIRGPRHELVKLSELMDKSKKTSRDPFENESTTSR